MTTSKLITLIILILFFMVADYGLLRIMADEEASKSKWGRISKVVLAILIILNVMLLSVYLF